MEVFIGICIGMVIALVFRKRKQPSKVMSSSKDGNVRTEINRPQQAEEELITIILPTINHDK